ncbi:MAG: hypothetical protein DME39_08080 [Verrucomicrobia bacterium]|nr:MAG: hypothetical protein DME39_08080 [Verrucomicrobiota bacterium]
MRTTRSTFQSWIGFSEGDVKTIAGGAESFAQKKTPPSGWLNQVKVLGGVPPLPQIRLNSEQSVCEK